MEDGKAVVIVGSGTQFLGGPFVVLLPWKSGAKIGFGNYASALTRLRQSQRKLARDEKERMRWKKSMETTIERGYATSLPSPQSEHNHYFRCYLPHHSVIKLRKPEELRIVVDCAAKHGGRLLNDMLCQGPDTAANLVRILLRFCKERIAVSVEVVEMFM